MKKIHSIYLVAFIFSVLGIIYQLLIAQALTVLSGNSIVKYSLVIGFYLFASGIGSFLVGKKSLKKIPEVLLKTELLVSLVATISIPVIYFFHIFQRYLVLTPSRQQFFILIFWLVSGVIIVAVGWLKGRELALIIGLSKEHHFKQVNIVLSLDYFGCLAGALIFYFILISQFNLFQIVAISAVANLLTVFIFVIYYFSFSNRRFLSVSVILFILTIAFAVNSATIEQYFLKKFYFRPYEINFSTVFMPNKDVPDIQIFDSPYQQISLTKISAVNPSIYIDTNDYSRDIYLLSRYSRKLFIQPDFPANYLFSLNGNIQSFSGSEELNAEYSVHVPIIANGVPERVLIIGGGNGITAREILKYDQVKEIIQVEIDPEVIRLAKENKIFKTINNDSLNDPRVHVVVDDGFAFLKVNHSRFDAVFIDVQWPYDYNLSRIFSRELFSFVKNRLEPAGFLAIVAIFSPTDTANWEILRNTLSVAGFQTIVPYFTVLEDSNAAAIEFIKKITADLANQGKLIDHQKLLKQYLLEIFLAGHIYAKVQPSVDHLAYQDFNLPLNVLNQQRFDLAFDYSYLSFNPVVESNGVKRVNSIFQPAFYVLFKH